MKSYQQWQQCYEAARESESVKAIQEWATITQPTNPFSVDPSEFLKCVLPSKGP
jgi:hypothetical protein